MILTAIENALLMTQKRGWDKMYWAFDIHGVIFPNTYQNNADEPFYPYALEVLQFLSLRQDICLILYTCSHPREIEQYLQRFEANKIHFQYVNKNPEASNTAYGNYVDKPYFNVLFEDKAGFRPEMDWKLVLDFIQTRF